MNWRGVSLFEYYGDGSGKERIDMKYSVEGRFRNLIVNWRWDRRKWL